MNTGCNSPGDFEMTLQHLGCGGLLLQGFAQLVEQARVLNGDHCLGGKVLNQLNLFVGERSHLLPVDLDRTDQLVLLAVIGTTSKVR